MEKRILAIMLLYVLYFCVANVQAELIQINLTATVDYVEDNSNFLEGKVHVNDTITGSYTYESLTADTNPAIDVGDYWHYSTPAGVSLSVGGFEFKTKSTDVQFLAEMINDSTSGGLHDSYLWHSYSNLSLSNGTLVEIISWSLRDSTATALSSDTLLVTAPVLSQWQTNQLEMRYGSDYLIRSHVTDVILVPEPATILLLGLGGILFTKRK